MMMVRSMIVTLSVIRAMGGISIVFMMRMLCAIIVSNGLVSTVAVVSICVSVMLGLEEMFDAAIGSGQQPKHHTARCHEA